MTARQAWILMIVLLVAAWAQAALSDHILIFNGRPEFVLTTIICISILTGSVNSALLNVWGGFLTAALAGINYGSIMISRLITGAFAGLLKQHIIEDSLIVPPTTVFVGTWICEGIYFLMAPNLHTIRWWVRIVLGESWYNAALSIPIYFALRLIRFKDQTENKLNPFFEQM